MEQYLEEISKKDECIQTDIEINGELFKHFITPFVEVTLAVGKINTQMLDPLIIVSPKGAFFIAKTVREKGDGEGSVFFITNKIKSDVLSYICMDFNKDFLQFCRNVRKQDIVKVHFEREFYFINETKMKEQLGVNSIRVQNPKYVYKAAANNIEEIQKEVHYSIKLMSDVPKKWTANITLPAREVKKFYLNIWRMLHRAVFYHAVNGNEALSAAYSEDALRDLFREQWEINGIEPMFETPKRRFFMARHYKSEEDGINCNGNGQVVFRANWRILKDIAQSGLNFELKFSDFKTPYGIIVKDGHSVFMQICENTFEDPQIVHDDVAKTLKGMMHIEQKLIATN